MNGEKISVICEDMEFAVENGFSEFERGIWGKNFDISYFNIFYLSKYIENTGERTTVKIDVNEFLSLWKKYVSDVSL